MIPRREAECTTRTVSTIRGMPSFAVGSYGNRTGKLSGNNDLVRIIFHVDVHQSTLLRVSQWCITVNMMPPATPKQRMLILADGRLDLFTAKTTVGLLRYRPDDVVAVLDREHAGGDLEQLVGAGKGVPIVESVEAALPLRPDTFVIGIAPPGGKLPDAWSNIIMAAIRAKMDIVSGLHTSLADVPEFAALAQQHGVNLIDIRKSTDELTVGTGRAADVEARRILTVGTDCNLGKKLAALEITRGLQQRGSDAVFVPTGQTGIMIAGWGIAIDAVLSDYVSGAVEKMILAKQDAEFLVIEGQGSLVSPSYSGVTLGLLHGTLPHDMILCHAPQRKTIRHLTIPLPPVEEHIRLHESILAPLFPSRVIGIALNCFGMSEDELKKTVEALEARTGLPTTDCVRCGPDKLVDAVWERRRLEEK